MIKSDDCSICGHQKMVTQGISSASLFRPHNLGGGAGEIKTIESRPILASTRVRGHETLKVWCGNCGVMYSPESLP